TGSKAANSRRPPDCRMIDDNALREVLYGGALVAVAIVQAGATQPSAYAARTPPSLSTWISLKFSRFRSPPQVVPPVQLDPIRPASLPVAFTNAYELPRSDVVAIERCH